MTALLAHLWSAFAVVFTFGLVIFIHESGHFIVCRLLGIRVEKFAFGFGPELFGFDRGGTRFSVHALPLGGFVKPAGESLEESAGHPDEYFAKPWYQRLLVVYAGPVMNYILAWALFFGLVYFKGLPESSNLTTIGDVFIDFPAYKAGIRPNDVIKEVDGQAVSEWKTLAERINKNPDKELVVKFERGTETRTVKVTPRLDAASGRGLIGIAPTTITKQLGLLGSAKEGVDLCWHYTRTTVVELAGKIYKREKPDMAGPIGIIQMVSRAAKSGIEDLLSFIAVISIMIGFFNFLPVPLLDGGHAAMYWWEGLTRKPLTEKAMTYANSAGIAFLLTILLFATYQDIARILKKRAAPAAEQDSSIVISTVPASVPIPKK